MRSKCRCRYTNRSRAPRNNQNLEWVAAWERHTGRSSIYLIPDPSCSANASCAKFSRTIARCGRAAGKGDTEGEGERENKERERNRGGQAKPNNPISVRSLVRRARSNETGWRRTDCDRTTSRNLIAGHRHQRTSVKPPQASYDPLETLPGHGSRKRVKLHRRFVSMNSAPGLSPVSSNFHPSLIFDRSFGFN